MIPCERCHLPVAGTTEHLEAIMCVDALIAEAERLRAALVHIRLDVREVLNLDQLSRFALATVPMRAALASIDDRAVDALATHEKGEG